MRYTTKNLKRLEDLVLELGYVLRYEKGQFQSGYCWVKDKNIFVINKFFAPEMRWQILLELLGQISPPQVEGLSPESRVFFSQIRDLLEPKSPKK